MSNFGKRMVPEYLIKEIGQGGGSEYTAGTGIDITEDVISVDTETMATKEYVDQHAGATYTAGTGIDITNNEINVDTNTVAMKTDIPEDLPTYGIKYQIDPVNTTLADLMAAGMPILSTTDTDPDYPDNVVNIAKQGSCYLEGIFAIRCQTVSGNKKYNLFLLSDTKNSLDVSKMTVKKKAIRAGDRDYTIDDTR